MLMTKTNGEEARIVANTLSTGNSATPKKESEFNREGAKLQLVHNDLLELVQSLHEQLAQVITSESGEKVEDPAEPQPQTNIAKFIYEERYKVQRAVNTLRSILIRLEI